MDYMLGVIVTLGIVLRCMVSLHPYSGNSCGYNGRLECKIVVSSTCN